MPIPIFDSTTMRKWKLEKLSKNIKLNNNPNPLDNPQGGCYNLRVVKKTVTRHMNLKAANKSLAKYTRFQIAVDSIWYSVQCEGQDMVGGLDTVLDAYQWAIKKESYYMTFPSVG